MSEIVFALFPIREPILPTGRILLGVGPCQAANSRPALNMVGSGAVATRAVAAIAQIPGMEESDFATGFTLWI